VILRVTIIFDNRRKFEYETEFPVKSIESLADDILGEMASILARTMKKEKVKLWMENFRPYLLSQLYECLQNMECMEDRCEGESEYERKERRMETECIIRFKPEERHIVERELSRLIGEVPPLSEEELEENLKKHKCLWKIVEPLLEITPYEELFNILELGYWFTLYATRVRT